MKTKQYIGYGGKCHDSQPEAKASFRLADLGFLHSGKKFDKRFLDPEGTDFGAYDDFFHARYGLHLEFKAADLNGVKTKASSDKQLEAKKAWRGGSLNMKDYLDYGWNHSKTKQAIVQAAYTPDRFIVCFDKAPPFAEALAYLKAGVVFCTLASLPSYLCYIRLKQLGIAAGFSEHYTLTDEAGTAHPAGFTYGPCKVSSH